MRKNLHLILLGVAAAVVIVLIGAAVYFLQATHMSAIVGLPMLSIGAVVLLVILLSVMAVTFASFDLQDKTQALALPEGSIRAVIALMLIVLFAILSIYLYGSISSRQESYMGKLEVGTRDALVKTFGDNVMSFPADDGKLYDVWLRQSASPEGVDFAKQLLVLVGTLVTSISSFYFGSRAATQTTPATDRAASPSPPVVGSFTPSTYTRGAGAQDFVIQGSGLDRITGVKLSLNGKQILASAVKANADRVQFKLDVPQSQDAGTWTLVLIDSKFGEQSASQTLTVN